MNKPWLVKLLLDLGFYSHMDRLLWSRFLHIEFQAVEAELRQAANKAEVGKILIDRVDKVKSNVDSLIEEFKQEIFIKTKDKL